MNCKLVINLLSHCYAISGASFAQVFVLAVQNEKAGEKKKITIWKQPVDRSILGSNQCDVWLFHYCLFSSKGYGIGTLYLN